MKHLLVIASFSALLFSAVAAQADYSAEATITIGDDSIQTIPFGTDEVTFNWTGVGSFAHSHASTAYLPDYMSDEDSRGNFDEEYFTDALTEKATGGTVRTSSTLRASASSLSDMNRVGYDYNYANAYVENYGYFEITGQGIVYALLDWSIMLDGPAGDAENWGSGDVYVYVDYGDDMNHFGYADDSYSFSGEFGDQGEHTGQLAVAIVNGSGGTITGQILFGASASASSVSVPEPSGLALMLAGIGFLGLVVRRRFK